MIQKIFLLGFLLLHVSILNAKKIPLDTTLVRFRYDVSAVEDTLNPEKTADYTFLLQAGKNVSKYSEYNWFLADSTSESIAKELNIDLYNINVKTFGIIKDRMDAQNIPMFGNSFLEIFNYHSTKEIIYYDRFAFTQYQYEDTLGLQKWTLSEDTATICGYVCRKATSRFRGRDYEAWYAPEIPISEGPWKFAGLPGMILKIEDAQKHHRFECVAVERPDWIDVIYRKEKLEIIKTDRHNFEETKKRYKNNPGLFLTGHPLSPKSPYPKHTYEKRPYNPIEREE